MRPAARCCLLAVTSLLLASSLLVFSASLFPPSSFVGISPQDEKYYAGSTIACRDGSKTFPRDRLNDGFCDCPDGTDEPGTSACPEGKFYCRNVGDVPRILFSSRVNDRICDCCDGSDEYDGGVVCQNSCLKGGADGLSNGYSFLSIDTESDQINMKEKNFGIDLEDLVLYLKGLRVFTILELASLIGLMAFVCRRTKLRQKQRRNYTNIYTYIEELLRHQHSYLHGCRKFLLR
ncbi:hypothetical protein HPP92_019753 [Vanilla planifolia]|uniref:Glucosidase II beta subunit N-terminal domain-containing protein n=1 Tax=Vanilla planifolia TaxID=51239 RepID=A0A835Q4M9_VANPL|nr:hypothetical protein HPP92_019753 [Vanilla planifolia]